MASIVNNFRIQQPVCCLHSQPCSHTLLQNCRLKLICKKCIPIYKSTTPQKILSLPQLHQSLTSTLTSTQQSLTKQSHINIQTFLQQKLRQLQQKHYTIFQQLLKRLSEQKEYLMAVYAQILKKYQQQEQKYLANVQQRNTIIKYLKQYANDQELFKLKLMVSNQYGLTGFIAQIRMLQVLNQQNRNRNVGGIIAEMEGKVRDAAKDGFIGSLENLLLDRDRFSTNMNINANNIGALHPLNLQNRAQPQKPYQNTQRRNQSQQNIQIRTPRTSRQQSFAQLPKLAFN